MRRRALAAALTALAATAALLAAILGGGNGRAPGSGTVGHATAAPPSARPTTGEPPSHPAPAGEVYGISVNRLFNDRAFTLAEIDAQLTAVAASGVTVVRSDALWEATERRGPVGGVHHYDWGFDDLVAGALAAHGLRWLPILDYTAAYAESAPGREHSAPVRASDFAAFAAALAARYGDRGSFWSAHPELRADPVETYEVWNEPDNRAFWLPAPDPARYADLYLAARAGILAADPAARVIVGGLTRPASFLTAMVAARPALVGHVDGVAIHPYGARPDVVQRRVVRARATLREIGLQDVPLYVTEFGWTTSPPRSLDWASAPRRPGYIAAAVGALAHGFCGVAAAVLSPRG